MITISQLGTMKDRGYGFTGFCERRDCGHFAPVNLDALIDRFGRDFDTVAGRDQIVAALKCRKCGGKEMDIHLNAPDGFGGIGGHR
jgi:hypothetical protein